MLEQDWFGSMECWPDSHKGIDVTVLGCDSVFFVNLSVLGYDLAHIVEPIIKVRVWFISHQQLVGAKNSNQNKTDKL